MRSLLRVAWKQLSHQRMKLVSAVAGVAVAVMLMLVQLGIRQGALDNGVAFARRVQADIVLLSPETRTIYQSSQFPRRLLYRLPGHPSVEAVQGIYFSAAKWQNPWDLKEHPIGIYGFESPHMLIDVPGYQEQRGLLRLRDRVLFDRRSRRIYGPVEAAIRKDGPLTVQINTRNIDVVGCTSVGASFVTDGSVYTSSLNFLRMFPSRSLSSLDMGLVKLKAGADAAKVLRELKPLVGSEVRLLSRQELVDDEVYFLRSTAPLDFIFGMGAAVGFFIGFVVVYQILYTEVTNHLPQFATLKAIGFTDGYLLKLVVCEAMILSILGYIPGFLMSIQLYKVATNEIQIPFAMTLARASGVFCLTLLMCGLSAAIAIRKAQTADPADVF